MQTESLSTQGLKQLLQKVIGQKPQVEVIVEAPAPAPAAALNEPPEPIVEEIAAVAETINSAEAIAVPAIAVPTIAVAAIPAAKSEPKEKESDSSKKTIRDLKAKISELKDNLEVEAAAKEASLAEILKLKETIGSLTRSLEEAETAAKARVDELALKVHASSLDNHEAKGRLLHFITEKKELEDQLLALSCEKATLTARNQSQAQKVAKLEEAEAHLSEKMKDLSKTLLDTTEELKTSQDLLNKLEAQKIEREAKIQDLITRLEDALERSKSHQTSSEELQIKNRQLQELSDENQKTHAQELAVCQACLQEQAQVLEEEQKQHRLLQQEQIFIQKRAEEQENHLRLLEQHLARRVKECALLSKQIEDLMDRTSHLQNALTTSTQETSSLKEALDTAKRIENALRFEFDSQANSYQDSLQSRDAELSELRLTLQAKEDELTFLRRVQMQFSELEELMKRSQQILSSKEQKELFSFALPESNSLFEPQ